MQIQAKSCILRYRISLHARSKQEMNSTNNTHEKWTSLIRLHVGNFCCVTFRALQTLTSLQSKNFCFLRRYCICYLYCCGKSLLFLRPVVKYRYFSAQWPKRIFSPFFENLVEETRTKREKRIARDSIQRPQGTERRCSYKKCRYTFRDRAKQF